MTRLYGGTGLGLSISKQLAEMMEGEIKVDSEVDKGSCFQFSVTLKVAESNHSIAQTNNDESDKVDDTLSLHAIRSIPEANILLVEDHCYDSQCNEG